MYSLVWKIKWKTDGETNGRMFIWIDKWTEFSRNWRRSWRKEYTNLVMYMQRNEDRGYREQQQQQQQQDEGEERLRMWVWGAMGLPDVKSLDTGRENLVVWEGSIYFFVCVSLSVSLSPSYSVVSLVNICCAPPAYIPTYLFVYSTDKGFRQIDRQTDRQTKKQRDREDRQPGRQIEREKEREETEKLCQRKKWNAETDPVCCDRLSVVVMVVGVWVARRLTNYSTL